MPVEIKELLIRAVVTDEGKEKPMPDGTKSPVGAHDVIVRRAVDEVLRILKESKER